MTRTLPIDEFVTGSKSLEIFPETCYSSQRIGPSHALSSLQS